MLGLPSAWAQMSAYNVQLLSKPTAAADRAYLGITNYFPGTGVTFTAKGPLGLIINRSGGGGGGITTNNYFYTTNYYTTNSTIITTNNYSIITNNYTTNLYSITTNTYTTNLYSITTNSYSTNLYSITTNTYTTNNYSISQTNIYATNLLGLVAGTNIAFRTNVSGALFIDSLGSTNTVVAGLISNVLFSSDGVTNQAGFKANGTNYGTVVGYNATAYNFGAGVGDQAWAWNFGAAVGYDSVAQEHGAAVGTTANGYLYGASVGYASDGDTYGAAVGSSAQAYGNGVCIGANAHGSSYGTAVGYGSLGSGSGNSALACFAQVTAGLTDTCEIGNGIAKLNGWFHYRATPVIGPLGQITSPNVTATNGFASTSRNLKAPVSISVTGSPLNFTNSSAGGTGGTNNVFVFIDGSGVTGSVALNGTTIFSALVGADATVPLQPGEYITCTYSLGTPVLTWKPF